MTDETRLGLILVLCSLALGACSVVGVRSGTEQPRYDVVARLERGVEVRRYGARLAAETTVAAADGPAARGRAFRTLAAYIFGDNRPRAKIAMTAPVEIGERIAMTAPVTTSGAGDRLTMRFLMPASFTVATLPEPIDPRVRIVPVDEETLAVLRFSGSTGPAAIAARTAELVAVVDGSPWQATRPAFAQFYDPPWTVPFLRRNEVAIPVAPRDQSTSNT